MAHEEVRSREWVDRIDELVRETEALPDPRAKHIAVELARAIMDLHAAALERMLELAEAGSPDGKFLTSIAADDVTSSVLLLHGLHPDDFATRVNRAVEKLQLRFNPQGGKVSVLGTDGGVVRLRFESSRGWSGTPVRTIIEDAIHDLAPEAEGVVIEGVRDEQSPGFVPISNLLAGQPV